MRKDPPLTHTHTHTQTDDSNGWLHKVIDADVNKLSRVHVESGNVHVVARLVDMTTVDTLPGSCLKKRSSVVVVHDDQKTRLVFSGFLGEFSLPV